ncbi:RNA polymerase [Tuhoko virus 1]|uniref:RNA-directed RNA polymerase L n=1 Tax=Tuhoko virus 1 TaxID=798072 RepID=D8WJ28_9MONO|nr:RNA polymerase [Tuhoko virus 1]ADI80715.1 RNA polymerase [Tuhoko virus 1]
MAAPSQIILPEVHLDSPIVKNKLIYFVKLAGLPLPDEDLEDDPFPAVDWARIRREENRLSDRLNQVKSRLYSEIIDSFPKSEFSLFVSKLNVLLWPKVLPIVTTWTIPELTERFSDVYTIIQRSCDIISSGASNLLRDISYQLSKSTELFTRNSLHCSIHDQHTRPSDLSQLALLESNSDYMHQFNVWFIIRLKMRQQILANQDSSQHLQLVELGKKDHKIYITPEIVCIWIREKKIITYFTFEMVLMVCDMIEGRRNVLALTKYSCYLAPLLPRLKRIFSIVDELCEHLGNSVYSVVASLESLVYAELQLADPVPELRGEFHAFISQELINAITSKGIISDQEANIICTRLLECYHNLPPDLVAELLCTMRLWGHPMLNAETAAKKVRASMCAPKMLDLTIILKVKAFFHGIIVNGYRRKHNGIWPKVILPPFASPSLTEFFHDNSELPYHYILAHWKEIAFLQFDKSFDADPGEDLSIFMKDKAISTPKKNWMSVFRKSLIKPTCDKLKVPYPEPFNRRLLINFLQDNNFDPTEELKYVTTGEYLDDNEFCASYSMKEKEIKEDGRIFAKLTKRMRSCQVICESLLASHAGKLFKENGVTLDQLSLTKSLLTMSQIGLISKSSRRAARDNIDIIHHVADIRKGNQYAKVNVKPSTHAIPKPDEISEIAACFLTTDLKKYCLQWRYQSIIPFATSLNQLYGYNHLFEWIHLRLMRSTLYVGDPFSPPRDLDTPDLDNVQNKGIFIVSARGGIEGLCQKMWTMISIAVIILSATESNTRVMCMVQGDNQAIAITSKVPRTLSYEHKKQIAFNHSKLFIERLRINNHGIGHHLKDQETIVSSELFIYSKRVLYKGRILNQALKNASKLCLIADVLSECTQTSASNLTTTIMRLTENGIEKDICYYWSVYYTIRQLVHDLMFPLTQLFEEDVVTTYLNNPGLIAKLAILPSQLGGLNYYAISRLFCRNIGDPLTSSISDVKRFMRAGILPRWILKNILSRPSGDGSWVTLAADPYSINIPYLYPPTTMLKKHTQRVLMESSTNPMLRGVFYDGALQEESELAKFLLDRPVVMPRVAHIIIEQSSCGRRKQIQGYLDTTRTIIRYALKLAPLSYKKTTKVLDYNLLYLSYNLELIKHSTKSSAHPLASQDLSDVCSIDISQLLRKLSWTNLLNGRGLQGLETPDPIELLNGFLITGTTSCIACMEGDSKFTWLFLPAGIDLQAPPDENPPIRVPYVGSRTDERRVASMGYVKGASQALKSSLRLTGVYIWAYGETDYNWDQALMLANTRAAINKEQLQALTPLPTSSNLVHRLDDGLTQLKFTPASSYAFSSYVHISNDSQNLELLERQLDSNLIYQQVMLLGLGIIETWLQFPNEQNQSDLSVHLHTGSSCCIRQVDSCIINESSSNVPILNVPYQNHFVFDPSPLSDEQAIQVKNLTFQTNISALDMIPLNDKFPVLAHLIGIQIAHSLTGLDESTSLINDAVVETDYACNWISECLNTQLDKVFYYAAWHLLLDLAYQLYYLRVLGQHAILDYYTTILYRIPGLALTGISSTISHPKLLRRMINLGIIIPRNAPYLATLDYQKMSTDALIWGAKHVLSDLMHGIDIEIIVPSEDSTEISDRVLNLVARKLSLCALIFNSDSVLPHVRGLAPDEKCRALTDAILHMFNNSLGQSDRIESLQAMIVMPKISAYPNNLYYLTRKLLNWIRDSDEAQLLLATFYDSFGFFETQHSLSMTPSILKEEDADSTLTDYDSVITIQSQGDDLQAISFPATSVYDPVPPNVAVSPPVHHILRPIGLSSTSWYKGLSVLRVLHTYQLPKGNHLYLAEGSGAIMTLMEANYPADVIFYNSYFSSGQCPPQRNFQPLPTQFIESVVYKNLQLGIPSDNGNVQEFKPLWSGNSVQTDLSTKECVDYIISQVNAHTLSLITLDIEEPTPEGVHDVSPALINSFLIAHFALKAQGIMIIKTHLSPFHRFSRIITLASKEFGSITAVRSSYSDPNSDELYLILQRVAITNPRDFTLALESMNQLHEAGFTLVSEDKLTELIDGLRENQQQIYNEIEYQNKMASCTSNLTDHITLSQLGSCIQTNKILEKAPAHSMTELLERICTAVTTFLKEMIALTEAAVIDKSALIYNSYNLQLPGKINTSAKLVATQILELYIRNWDLISIDLRLKLIQMIELGYFSVGEILSTNDFIKYTNVPNYLRKVLGMTTIDQELHLRLKVYLSRAQQKRVWKSVGSVILTGTLDGSQLPEFDTQSDKFEDEERDLAGDLID